MPYSFTNLLVFLLSSIACSALATHRHVIVIPSAVPRPACFTWDPTAQHFVIGSALHSNIFSVSDAGVAETIVSDPLLAPSSFISSVYVDNRRRRLLVALSGPDALAAYDLRSPRPHPRIFFSSLPAPPGGIALDPATGFVFVIGSDSGVVWRADLDGSVSDFSRSASYGSDGLSAVAYVSKGFLIAVQGKTGRVFKVDEEYGAAKEVIGKNGILALSTETMVLMADGDAVLAGGRGVRLVQSGDAWAEAAVKSEVKVEEGTKCQGVTVRNGNKAYVLLSLETERDGKGLGNSRIEEVEWEEEGDMLWMMVLVGFALAYFLYWRFQMKQLVSNMNKKRA